MVYETNLLDPIWWINSLFGDWILFIAIMELFILTQIRKIPNVKGLIAVILVLNATILLYGFMSGVGATIGTGLMTLIVVIYGIIAWSAYENS